MGLKHSGLGVLAATAMPGFARVAPSASSGWRLRETGSSGQGMMVRAQTLNTCWSAWLALLLSAWPGWASAGQGDVLRPYVSYGVTYDDNLLRVNSAADAIALFGSEQTSDTINRATVGITIDKQISLQHLNINLELNRDTFNRFNILDNDERNFSGKWNWHLGNHLQGNLGASHTRSLGTFLEFRQLVRNDRTRNRTFADLAWRFHPSWRLRTSASTYDLENSIAAQRTQDRSEDAAEIGVDYLTSSGSRVGVRYRQVEGTFPNRQLVEGSLVDNGYRQDEASAVADWRYSGKTRLQFEAGMVKRNHNQVSARDFTGLTGRATLGWAPTGKITLSLVGWRDINAVGDATASFSDNLGVSLTPAWAITSKLSLQGKFSYEQQDHAGDPGLVLTAQPRRQDTFRSAMAAVSYTPLQDLQLSFSMQHDERQSNISERRFKSNSVMLNSRYEF